MSFFVRVLIVVLVVMSATAFAQWQLQRLHQKQDARASFVAHNTTKRVRIGNNSLNVEIADTDIERAQGLSRKTSLAENAGMLFVFDTPGFYNFWMYNMNFPIDIIWIDEYQRVIGIVENAPPLKPGEDTILYSPPKPIQYALEVNAGFSARHNIAVGQQIEFE